jgi:hypothetical protein
MELALGRRLRSDEVIHHKDHNKLNNDLDNLELTNRRDHVLKHSGFQDAVSKECSKCHTIKPHSEFYVLSRPRKNCQDLYSRCIQCLKDDYKARPKEFRGRAKKLTPEIVREIRRIYALGGIRQKDLGEQFGIAQNMVWTIVHNVYWKHV